MMKYLITALQYMVLLAMSVVQTTHASDRPIAPSYQGWVNIPGTQGHDLYTVVVPTIFNIIFGTLGTVGLILLFVGGAKAVMSRGNADEFKKAILNIVFVVVGMAVIGLAYTIVRMVVNITYG